ncbi:MAG: intradiol ring-cleavage dioxygenase [Geminicoccaceae bacterium]
MSFFSEAGSEAAVIARLAECRDPRLKQVVASAVRHLHAFVKDVEPTMDEWMTAISFLTRTGQMCDDRRQEWILLSDVLGVSMLVETINHRATGGATEQTVLGPFHVAGAPVLPHGSNICRDGKGTPCVVRGRVLGTDGRPVAHAILDVWQTSEDGFYDIQQPGVQPEGNLRGKFATDADGRYWFVTVKPCSYPIPTDGPVGDLLRGMGRHPFRPAHIHLIVGADGYEPVTTHIFVKGDPYLESDAVFGVKESLVREFVEVTDPAEAARLGVEAPFWTTEFDVRLKPAAVRQAAE